MSELQFLMFSQPYPIPPRVVRESVPRKTIAREILDYLRDEIDFVCVQEMADELGISDQSARNAIGPLVDTGVVVTMRKRHKWTTKTFARLNNENV